MIYKVFYQELPGEVPVRERTQSLYVEADSEKEVRNKLYDRKYNINIEFIHPLDEAHLKYEKQSEHFNLETV
ncbi:DNA-dependent RNA polymerase subunit epsilon [Virgibacillus sp. JSM 102003]|uniref:DNA-dependent RNA polymerase subunit epsilon n=1 Tax=Virgibacillus sp. JSM 102003 TaxID=1562108 RepID=UPI0035C24AE7